jgi:hypothetical protein
MKQYRTVKKRAILVGFAALLASVGARAEGWTDYRGVEGNFHVEMPGPPKVSTPPLSIGNNETAPMTEAVVRVPEAAYQVSYVLYPRRIAGAASADVLLDTFRNNMVAGRTYRGESKLTLGRLPGREFTVVETPARHTAVRLY